MEEYLILSRLKGNFYIKQTLKHLIWKIVTSAQQNSINESTNRKNVHVIYVNKKRVSI